MPYLHRLHETALKSGWQAIEGLIGEQETLDLEFKNKVTPDDGALTPKDREILGPLIVAFANSMGGLAVVGVDCREGDDGADQAQSIHPIANVRRFASEVRNNIPNFAMPRLEDVTVNFIEKPGAQGTGVVMISVGRSERRPHRCECKNRKSYFKRSGASTLEMEAFEIEDAYRRISIAKLEIDTPQVMEGGRSGNTDTRFLSFLVRNIANQTAKFPLVRIESITGGKVWEYGVNGSGYFPLARAHPLFPGTFAGDSNTVIHPGQSLEVFRLVFHVQIPSYEINSTDSHAAWPKGFIPPEQAHLDLTLITSCENAAPTRQVFEFRGRKLLQALGYGREPQ